MEIALSMLQRARSRHQAAMAMAMAMASKNGSGQQGVRIQMSDTSQHSFLIFTSTFFHLYLMREVI